MTNEEAIEVLNNWDMACPICEKRKSEEKGVCSDCRFNKALNLAIKALEERPHSKWVKIFENPFTNGYICPFCGHKIQVTEQFLPEVTECEVCGADMRGAENGG